MLHNGQQTKWRDVLKYRKILSLFVFLLGIIHRFRIYLFIYLFIINIDRLLQMQWTTLVRYCIKNKLFYDSFMTSTVFQTTLLELMRSMCYVT
jgi:hypothetical protein